jgi:hypothetical protein
METIAKYHIFLVSGSKDQLRREDNLHSKDLIDTHIEFDSEYLAEQWIIERSERNNIYTILKIFRTT